MPLCLISAGMGRGERFLTCEEISVLDCGFNNPAFSMGHTQELIYEMDRLFSDPKELRKIGDFGQD